MVDSYKDVVSDILKDIDEIKTTRLEKVGKYLKAKVLEGYLDQEMFGPPLAEKTLEAKARQGLDMRKLLATHDMANSFEYSVDNGVLSFGSDYMADEIGEPLCMVHEDGTSTIPARPMLKSIIDKEEGQIEKILEGKG
jgi:hypothetical protein